jgi:hypothetical protein
MALATAIATAIEVGSIRESKLSSLHFFECGNDEDKFDTKKDLHMFAFYTLEKNEPQ